MDHDPQPSLERIRSELWDPVVRLDRMAPGVVPGVDLTSFGLHSVRESALGAYADLADGDAARGVAALRAVLTHQYDDPGRPWDGTFRVTAEQADPPGDEAVEWFHYDPNWRQFMGTILLVTSFDHGERIPADVLDAVHSAVVRCARGEPAGRIPEWYTNPNLLHAWVAAHAGRLDGDAALVDVGVALARRTVERLERFGDVDEYNSPTYDGVDLLAAAVWVAFPPTPEFERWGTTLLGVLCARISTLVDPDLGAVCGPYLRAYGTALDRYVSLLGLWLTTAGLGGVLPERLDADTDHVHDLYFLPLIERLSDVVAPHWRLRPVDGERRHVQHLDALTCTSVLRPGCSIGWASGPVPTFSADQFVPVVAHVRAADGSVVDVAVRVDGGVSRVEANELDVGLLEIRVGGDGPGTVSVESSEAWTHSSAGAGAGPVTVEWSSPSAGVLAGDGPGASPDAGGRRLVVGVEREVPTVLLLTVTGATGFAAVVP